MRSPRLKLLAKERLMTVRRGPLTEFLTSSPNVPSLADAYAAGLRNCMAVPALNSAPATGGTPDFGLPTTSGYHEQPLHCEKLLFTVLTTVNGTPLWATTVPEIRHPPATSFSTALLFRYSFPLPKGNS